MAAQGGTSRPGTEAHWPVNQQHLQRGALPQQLLCDARVLPLRPAIGVSAHHANHQQAAVAAGSQRNRQPQKSDGYFWVADGQIIVLP